MTCVIATIVYSQRTAPKISEMPAWKDVIGFFEFCGIVVFSMEGIGVSLPIENNMKNPKQFPMVLCGGKSTFRYFINVRVFSADTTRTRKLMFKSSSFFEVVKKLCCCFKLLLQAIIPIIYDQYDLNL